MKKSTRQPKKSVNLLLAAVAVIILITVILLLTLRPFSTRDDAEKLSPISVPEFRHDGELRFITGDGADTVAIDIEVVDTQEEISRGLMYRPHLPESSGMLFVFPEEEVRSFWMKNTYIALDIIFVSTGKEIVTIQEHTQPLSTQAVPSYQPARYVIEVNAGFTGENNIKAGDRIEF